MAKKTPPALKSHFWADLSTLDFERLRRSGDVGRVVAVLPVAAIEQHGPHLPLCVDQCLVDGVITGALPLLRPRLPVLFLPTQQVGRSEEHVRFPGTLSLGAQTLMRVWMDLGECVARFRDKLVKPLPPPGRPGAIVSVNPAHRIV